jgi:hypothetical protein
MNHEIYPGGIYPLQGDVLSQVGSSTVTVSGLQNIPIAANGTPSGGSYLAYNVNTNNWEPLLQAAIQVNSITASDDGMMSVNVPSPATVNGVS